MTGSDARDKIRVFRKLHESGCFIMPNPWDIGSAQMLAHIGFKAIATTSAGFAFTRGLPDTVTALDLGMVLAHTREIVAASPLPVNADFQDGYAREPERVADNVRRCIETGVAGLSIEDATGDLASPLYDQTLAIERITAAREAIDQSGSDVVLTARCEAWLVGVPDCEDVALDRLVAFARAGADCLYAPLVLRPEENQRIVQAVAPKPVNVLVSVPTSNLTVTQLREIGVRRISVGSGLAKAAMAAALRSAQEMLDHGTFYSLAEAKSFGSFDSYLGQ